jgi:hypothetical protein
MTNPFVSSLELLRLIFRELKIVGGFLLSLWWIYLPVFLYVCAYDLWLMDKRQKYIQGMEWVLLEVTPPRDIEKTPRSTEQIFAGLHGVQTTPIWKDRFYKGAVQPWFSFETASKGGEIHFYVRTLASFRNLAESHIYAQYPEAEICEVEDYINSVPQDVPEGEYDLWGTELIFVKDDAYPIRTYPTFEKDIMLKEQRVDPVASLLEVMGELKPGENIWIQTLIRPIGDAWKKEGEKIRDKIIGRKAKVVEGELKKEAGAWKEASKDVLSHLLTGGPAGEAAKEEKQEPVKLTKAEEEVVYAIESDISKLGYETIIRFLYLAPKEIINRANVSAVIGCYKQFGTQNLNAFMPNIRVTTKIDYDYQLKKIRERYRKKRIFKDYRTRDFTLHSKYIKYLKPFLFEKMPILNWFFIRSKPMVLSIEELATVYHYPGIMVKAPTVPKVEAKKGEPPMRLPVEL